MSCPTCDHTMQRLAGHVFWCPRCGTLKTAPGEREEIEAPELVKRCRAFYVQGEHAPGFLESWQRIWVGLGIREAINVPDERPKL